MTRLLYIIFLLAIASCATSPKRPEKSQKILDPRTTVRTTRLKNSRTQIDPKVIELYRRLRKKNWKKYTKPKRYQPIIKEAAIQRRALIKRKSPPVIPTPSSVSTPSAQSQYSESQKKEFSAEIQQNLAYFCMLKRNDPRYSPERRCQRFTKNVYSRCLDTAGGELTRSVVTCVKRDLK